MLSLPLVQSILFICFSVLPCVYVLLSNPFRVSFEQAIQIFHELSVFTVYICVLCLASLDYNHKSATSRRQQLEFTIVVVNLILNFGCSILMGLKILRLLWSAYKDYSSRKSNKVHMMTDNTNIRTMNDQSQVCIKPDEGGLHTNNSTTQQAVSFTMPKTTQVDSHEPGLEQIDKSTIFEHFSDTINPLVDENQHNNFESEATTPNKISPPKLQTMKKAAAPLSPQQATISLDSKKDRSTKQRHLSHSESEGFHSSQQ